MAQDFLIAKNVAVVIDAFSAEGALDALTFIAGKFLRVEMDADPFFCEEDVVGKFAVGEHLLAILVFDFRMQLAGGLFR